jgi:capsule polysaccharide export protein KpsC/LpsZ
MKKLSKQDFLDNVNKECEKRNYKLISYKFDEISLRQSYLQLYCLTHNITFDKNYAHFMKGRDCPKCGIDKQTGWNKNKIKLLLLEIINNKNENKNPIEIFISKYPKGYDAIKRNNWLEEFELYINNNPI